MAFFDPVPLPEHGEEEPEQPEWLGPPAGVLGGVVPAQLLLVRTGRMFIAATHITVHPNGIEFRIDARVRSPEPSPRRGGLPGFPDDDPSEGLRVGVLFPDGRKAQTHGRFPETTPPTPCSWVAVVAGTAPRGGRITGSGPSLRRATSSWWSPGRRAASSRAGRGSMAR